MGGGTETFSLALALLTLIGGAFASNAHEQHLSASAPTEFRTACEQVYAAIERAEQSLSAAAYESNLLAAEIALEAAMSAAGSSRDKDVISALKRYRLAVITLRDTLAFITDSADMTERALEVQSGALANVKTEIFGILHGGAATRVQASASASATSLHPAASGRFATD